MNSHQLVVIGAGAAGCAAAAEAAGLGLSVLLIDEHPQSTDAMSLDAPYFYGSRLPAALSDSSAVADAVLGSNEALMECLEAGVDVLTGTCAWGIFGPDAGDPLTRCRQIGLSNEASSWLDRYEYLIVAAGARDLILSFPNWHLPGVLGVKGATTLLERYGALGGSNILILGSGNAGLIFAQKALAAGIGVAGIVDPCNAIVGDNSRAEELKAADVPFFLSHTIGGAIGSREVEAARLTPIAADGQLAGADDVKVACDTICMAFGTVPNIELASVARCEMEFDRARSGWVPRLTAEMQSTDERIHIVGDAAGVSEAMALSDEIARQQGRIAARAIAMKIGVLERRPLEAAITSSAEAGVYPPNAWLDSLVKAGGEDVIVCQCEDVSRRDLLAVAPPHYLAADDRAPAAGLKSLTKHGQASQDLIKRLTRVGMGHCQGRRCRDQSMMLIAKEAQIDVSEVAPGSYRVPVRPLSLEVLWAGDESPELRGHWPAWLHDVDDIPEV